MFTLRAIIPSYFPPDWDCIFNCALGSEHESKKWFHWQSLYQNRCALKFFISVFYSFVKFQLHTRAYNLFDRVESHDFIRQMCRPKTADTHQICRLPERWNGSNLIKRMIEYSTVKTQATRDADKGETSKRKHLKLNAKIWNTNKMYIICQSANYHLWRKMK